MKKGQRVKRGAKKGSRKPPRPGQYYNTRSPADPPSTISNRWNRVVATDSFVLSTTQAVTGSDAISTQIRNQLAITPATGGIFEFILSKVEYWASEGSIMVSALQQVVPPTQSVTGIVSLTVEDHPAKNHFAHLALVCPAPVAIRQGNNFDMFTIRGSLTSQTVYVRYHCMWRINIPGDSPARVDTFLARSRMIPPMQRKHDVSVQDVKLDTNSDEDDEYDYDSDTAGAVMPSGVLASGYESHEHTNINTSRSAALGVD